MAGAELLEQVTGSSLMDNGKMEYNMDTLERFKKENAFKMNSKMVSYNESLIYK